MPATGNPACWPKRFADACSPASWLKSLLSLHASPRDIALGSSIGVFIAFTPTIGLQTVLAALGATLLGASRPAAMIPVWISNPITMGPMFALTYWVGSILCPANTLAVTSAGDRVDAAQADAAYASATHFLWAGTDLLLPLVVGGMVVGLACAVMTYPVIKYAVTSARHKNAIQHR